MNKHIGVCNVCIKSFVRVLIFVLIALSAEKLNVLAVYDPARTVKVGRFPYDEQIQVDENGNMSGYGYDYLEEIAHYTGWNYEFIDASWNDCLDMLMNGEIDLMGAVMLSPEREAFLDFSNYPMLSGYGVLVTSLPNSVLPYEDFQSFDGITVGVLKGSLHAQLFEEYSRMHGFTSIMKTYDSQFELDNAMENGEISTAIMTNLLHSSKLRVIAAFGENDSYFATTKGNSIILNQLNEAMRQIRLSDPYFNSRLDKKYNMLQAVTPISFTREELDFISNCPPIPCTYTLSDYPLSYYDKDSKSVQGIAADVCDLLSQRTGLLFSWIPASSPTEAYSLFHEGAAVLIPAKTYDSGWASENHAFFTNPYLEEQLIMISTGNSFGPMVVALPDDLFQSNLTALLPADTTKIKHYNTIHDCMDALLDGKVNTTFTNSATVSYLVNSPRYAQLKTTPVYGIPVNTVMAVSQDADPLLLSVLNKGLRNISYTELNSIVLSQTETRTSDPFAVYLYLHPVETVVLVSLVMLTLTILLLILLRIRWKVTLQMKKNLYTDSLTGYSNYTALLKESDNLIRSCPTEYALIYLDIHRFKVINDTFGYETGDHVLIATSDVLMSFIDKQERFARVHADIFVLLLNYTDPHILKTRLDKLSDELSHISVEGTSISNLLFCGGVYLIPKDFDGLDKACDRANYARESVSQHYSNTFIFYDDIMRKKILAEKELESQMLSALEHEEFVPYYQPKINIYNEKVVGAEALVRWHHPKKGRIPPSEFLPFYEKNGFIVKIDLSIFEHVCRDIRRWIEKGNQPVTISVNFSRRHMKDMTLPAKLKEITDRYQIPPSYLEIEITETEELDNVEMAVNFVNALKNYGFVISIDDYGTGYSSISFLQQLPLDALKLDKIFILNAMKSSKAEDIMRYLVAAMQKNGIRIMCEGIETKEQRDFIASLNCCYIQGYLYSVPLIRSDFENYLLFHGIDVPTIPTYISL